MPTNYSEEALRSLLLAMADDELVLGHRDSEWTGHAPILEEDIAFSNIAQDEIGHSLVWYTLLQQLNGKTPDEMGFHRTWDRFTCCRFVAYPKGDFGYTVLRQYLFDEAEHVRLSALTESAYSPLRDASAKILREEAYHLMHTKGLVERLGDATEESHSRMQLSADAAFPQALGMFEEIDGEKDLAGIIPPCSVLSARWLDRVVPVLISASLHVPVQHNNGSITPLCMPDSGGRKGNHTADLKQIVDDLQSVYRIAPGGKW